MEVVENPSRNLKKQAKAAAKRVDVDFDGDVDKNDTTYGGDYGEFVPSADGKKKLKTGRVKFASESAGQSQQAKERQAEMQKQRMRDQSAAMQKQQGQKDNEETVKQTTQNIIDKVKQAVDKAEKQKTKWYDELDDVK